MGKPLQEVLCTEADSQGTEFPIGRFAGRRGTRDPSVEG